MRGETQKNYISTFKLIFFFLAKNLHLIKIDKKNKKKEIERENLINRLGCANNLKLTFLWFIERHYEQKKTNKKKILLGSFAKNFKNQFKPYRFNWLRIQELKKLGSQKKKTSLDLSNTCLTRVQNPSNSMLIMWTTAFTTNLRITSRLVHIRHSPFLFSYTPPHPLPPLRTSTSIPFVCLRLNPLK